MSDTPEKSVKPTIPSERVPDFPARQTSSDPMRISGFIRT
jgi:hypothetical protein